VTRERRAAEPWRETVDRLPAEPGTYVIVLQVERRASVEVGKLGTVVFDEGFCLYVGSALGRGGLRARLARHLRGGETSHWHVDRLRAIATPVEIWVCVDDRRHEHAWSQLLASSRRFALPRGRFGASDCRCPAHLFASRRKPDVRSFRRLLAEHGSRHPPLRRFAVPGEERSAAGAISRGGARRRLERRDDVALG